MGSSAGLRVGQSVYAIGNADGVSRTLSAGVVSGLRRGIPSPTGGIMSGAIQVGPLELQLRQSHDSVFKSLCIDRPTTQHDRGSFLVCHNQLAIAADGRRNMLTSA